MANHTDLASLTVEPSTWRDVYPDTRNLQSGGEPGDAPPRIQSPRNAACDPDQV